VSTACRQSENKACKATKLTGASIEGTAQQQQQQQQQQWAHYEKYNSNNKNKSMAREIAVAYFYAAGK